MLLVQITSKAAIIVVIAVPCFIFLIVFCNKQTNPSLDHKKVDIFVYAETRLQEVQDLRFFLEFFSSSEERIVIVVQVYKPCERRERKSLRDAA